MKNDSARHKAIDNLVEAKLRSGLNPGSPSCLDAEILAAYVERTLTSLERANCQSHLASCARCQEQVAMLVRLGEADEPAGIQPKTAATARAADISWFRWAWAGPALAAMLVIGIYFNGPFRHNIQYAPGPTKSIQNPAPGRPSASPIVAKGTKNEMPRPAVSGPGRDQKGQPAESKALDSQLHAGSTAGRPEGPQTEPRKVGGLGGISDHKEPTAKPQNEETTRAQPAPQPSPAPANDRVVPAPAGAIATPSVRADLAKKDERGQGAGVGGNPAQGVAGGTISGTTSNKPTANRPMDNLATNSRNAQAISPQALPPPPPTTNEKNRSRKSALYDEAKAKKETKTDETERDNPLEDDREKQKAEQSVSIHASTQQVMVTSSAAAPVWRVGRHGLIQKLDARGKWKRQKSSVKADLYAIAFSGSDVGWAVGQAGTVLRTTDGGATWSQLPNPTTEDLVQVTAPSDQAASVVTRSGLTFNTIDGGITWSAGER